MPRLPLASAEDLRDELDEIARKLERLGEVRPVSRDAAARVVERRETLRRWQADLTAQLEELEPSRWTPVYGEFPPGF